MTAAAVVAGAPRQSNRWREGRDIFSEEPSLVIARGVIFGHVSSPVQTEVQWEPKMSSKNFQNVSPFKKYQNPY